jgi:hypothetical protein
MNAGHVTRPEEVIIPIVAIAMVFGLPMVWVVAHYVSYAFKQWQATALVRDMVARGYTAQEIIQICQVLGPKNKKVPDAKHLMDLPPAKPIRQPVMTG